MRCRAASLNQTECFTPSIHPSTHPSPTQTCTFEFKLQHLKLIPDKVDIPEDRTRLGLSDVAAVEGLLECAPVWAKTLKRLNLENNPIPAEQACALSHLTALSLLRCNRLDLDRPLALPQLELLYLGTSTVCEMGLWLRAPKLSQRSNGVFHLKLESGDATNTLLLQLATTHGILRVYPGLTLWCAGQPPRFSAPDVARWALITPLSVTGISVT